MLWLALLCRKQLVEVFKMFGFKRAFCFRGLFCRIVGFGSLNAGTFVKASSSLKALLPWSILDQIYQLRLGFKRAVEWNRKLFTI